MLLRGEGREMRGEEYVLRCAITCVPITVCDGKSRVMEGVGEMMSESGGCC